MSKADLSITLIKSSSEADVEETEVEGDDEDAWLKKTEERLFTKSLMARLAGSAPDPRRWWVVLLYGLTSIWSVVNWNIWNPIAPSALYAFPQWNSGTFALLNNWGPAVFLLLIGPSVHFLNTRGIKSSLIFGTTCSTLGAALRLIQIESIYTILVHCGAILNAVGGVLLSPCTLPLCTLWFPHGERTLALGVCTSMSSLGSALSYLIGPLLVDDVPPDPPPYFKQFVRSEIMVLNFLSFLVELFLLLLMVFIFPKAPQHLTISKLLQAVKGAKYNSVIKESYLLFKNVNFALLVLSCSLCIGISYPWFSFLPLIFRGTKITQKEAAHLGFLSVLCSCGVALTVTKLSSHCSEYKKFLIIGLILGADLMFFNILFMLIKLIKFREAWLSLSVVAGFSLVWSVPPLYLDLAAEITYPRSEGTVGGLMSALNRVVSLIVFTLLEIFHTDIIWLTYALPLSALISAGLLLFVKVDLRRMKASAYPLTNERRHSHFSRKPEQ